VTAAANDSCIDTAAIMGPSTENKRVTRSATAAMRMHLALASGARICNDRCATSTCSHIHFMKDHCLVRHCPPIKGYSMPALFPIAPVTTVCIRVLVWHMSFASRKQHTRVVILTQLLLLV
jgi:hypothetical protein